MMPPRPRRVVPSRRNQNHNWFVLVLMVVVVVVTFTFSSLYDNQNNNNNNNWLFASAQNVTDEEPPSGEVILPPPTGEVTLPPLPTDVNGTTNDIKDDPLDVDDTDMDNTTSTSTGTTPTTTTGSSTTTTELDGNYMNTLYESMTIRDVINELALEEFNENGLSYFREALLNCDNNMLDRILGNDNNNNPSDNTIVVEPITVFAPTNGAIKNHPTFLLYLNGLDEVPNPRWHDHLTATLYHHMIPNATYFYNDIFDNVKTTFNTMHTTYQDHKVEDDLTIDSLVNISQVSKRIGGGQFVSKLYNIITKNGIIHVIDHVLVPNFMNEPFGSSLELQIEYGPDYLDRVALVDVINTVPHARDQILNQIPSSTSSTSTSSTSSNPKGYTFIGCRIRAFNRMDEYLDQTINDSLNVTWGELMNVSDVNATKSNFIQYNLLPNNYYYDTIEDGTVQLVKSSSTTCSAHMWITKRHGILCFNNACTIESPNIRTYLASNGVGYVVDKCIVCPGVGMLTNYAAEYTPYNLKDTAQFLVASEWNLRDVRQSLFRLNTTTTTGSGSTTTKATTTAAVAVTSDGTSVEDDAITLFASINSGWDYFNIEDVTRLASDFWNPHKLNLLLHMFVKGRYTYLDLYTKYDQEGPYNLTSLANEPISIAYNEDTKRVTVAGGDIMKEDIEGYDGLVHFTSQVPLPKSVTQTVYDYAHQLPDLFSTQITLIDSVYIGADMKRLSPLTTLYAPNPAWDNKKLVLEEISTGVLENMIFKSLLWCDTLRSMVGQYAESHNQKYWSITLHEETNMPCFEFSNEQKVAEDGTSPSTSRSCITKCDILVRNGVVHEVDQVLLFEDPATVPPKQEGARLPGTNGDVFDEILSQPGLASDSSSNSNSINNNGAGMVDSTSGGSSTTTGSSGSGFQRPLPTAADLQASSAIGINHHTQYSIVVPVFLTSVLISVVGGFLVL